MYTHEKQRQTHLIILISSTVFVTLLTGEAILLDWEIGSVALLILGLAAGWAAHMTEWVSAQIRLWLYFAITMEGYFFYGLHETSIYDLAPVMICIILVYSTAEIQNTTDEPPMEQLSGQSIRETEMTRLEDLGVHTHSGMQYCRNDMVLYEELLVKFAQNGERKIPEIGDSFDREDFEQYRILIHALKSSAKMVGADSLSELSRQLEDAAKNDNRDYIKAHHDALLEQYHMLSRGILQVFDFGESTPVQMMRRDGTELSKTELIQQLTLLKEKLDVFEAESSEALLSQMGKAAYQGSLVRELLSGIRQDVDEFEFNAASEKTEALLRRIEGGEV